MATRFRKWNFFTTKRDAEARVNSMNKSKFVNKGKFSVKLFKKYDGNRDIYVVGRNEKYSKPKR